MINLVSKHHILLWILWYSSVPISSPLINILLHSQTKIKHFTPLYSILWPKLFFLTTQSPPPFSLFLSYWFLLSSPLLFLLLSSPPSPSLPPVRPTPDPCLVSPAPCSPEGSFCSVTNTLTGHNYKCTCLTGFRGDGYNCQRESPTLPCYFWRCHHELQECYLIK